jgi:hypothetical protein
VRFEYDEGQARLFIRGKITGEADLRPVAERLRGPVEVDLSEVYRLNSEGVLVWLAFLRALPEGVRLTLSRCSVAFVEQMNLLVGLARGQEVRSVLAPYLCEGCGAVREDEVPVSALLTGALPTPAPCPKCGGRMELDVLPDAYFAFARA